MTIIYFLLVLIWVLLLLVFVGIFRNGQRLEALIKLELEVMERWKIR